MRNATLDTLTLEKVYLPVLTAVGRLLRAIKSDRTLDCDFDRAMFLLETLPLTSDEFGVAKLRLNNAKLYSSNGELGAAGWEVKAVLNVLKAKVD